MISSHHARRSAPFRHRDKIPVAINPLDFCAFAGGLREESALTNCDARNSFRLRTYEASCKCCKQKTYSIAKSFRCNTYKKQRGGGASLLFPHSPLNTRYFTQVLSFHTLANSFAFRKNSTLFFSCDSKLFRKNTRGGVPHPLTTSNAERQLQFFQSPVTSHQSPVTSFPRPYRGPVFCFQLSTVDCQPFRARCLSASSHAQYNRLLVH
jgi:hypothetical protein